MAGCGSSMSRGAANGGQPDKSRGAVVIADIQRNRQAVATGAAAKNGKPGHGDNIPKPAGFVLGFDARRHGHIKIINGAGEENREADSGFLGGFGDFNLYAVGNGLRSGVRKDDLNFNFSFRPATLPTRFHDDRPQAPFRTSHISRIAVKSSHLLNQPCRIRNH